MIRTLVVSAAVALTAGCGTFSFFSAPAEKESTTSSAVLDRTDPAAVAARLHAVAGALEDATGARRTRLSLERATLAIDAAVLVDVLAGSDPMVADAWLEALRVAYPGRDVHVELERAAAVAADLEAAGEPAARVAKVRAMLAPTDDLPMPEAIWLRWADEEASIAPHLRLLSLHSAMRHIVEWARRGTGYGEGNLARECSFLCGPGHQSVDPIDQAASVGYTCEAWASREADGMSPDDDAIEAASRVALPQPGAEAWERLVHCPSARDLLPASPQRPSLLSPENVVDATVLRNLAALISAVDRDRTQGEPVAVGATRVIAEAMARREGTAVPAMLTTNLFLQDVTMDLPRVLLPPRIDDTALLVRAPRLRTVRVHSHEVRLAIHPSLRAVADAHAPDGFAVEWADESAGYGWPGELVATMERAGVLTSEALVDDGVPALAAALRTLDEQLEDRLWVPYEERAAAGPDISVFADGGVYLSTLVPLVGTMLASGYGRVLIHGWNDDAARPVILPMQIGGSVPDGAHRVLVREDGFVIEAWDPSRMAAGVAVSRLEPHALLRLHRTLRELRTSGRLDPERRIVIRVDDLSTDLGILSHLVLALAWERELDGVATDRGLLEAPMVRDAGRPVELTGAATLVAPG